MKKLFLISDFIIISLIFTACSGSTPPLSGAWKLVSYGEASSQVSALPNVETSINFNTEGQLNGGVGCNTFSATYQVENDKVIIQSISSTRMFCKDIGEQENIVLAILSNQTLIFELNGNQLTLSTQDGSSAIVLEKK